MWWRREQCAGGASGITGGTGAGKTSAAAGAGGAWAAGICDCDALCYDMLCGTGTALHSRHRRRLPWRRVRAATANWTGRSWGRRASFPTRRTLEQLNGIISRHLVPEVPADGTAGRRARCWWPSDADQPDDRRAGGQLCDRTVARAGAPASCGFGGSWRGTISRRSTPACVSHAQQAGRAIIVGNCDCDAGKRG